MARVKSVYCDECGCYRMQTKVASGKSAGDRVGDIFLTVISLGVYQMVGMGDYDNVWRCPKCGTLNDD